MTVMFGNGNSEFGKFSLEYIEDMIEFSESTECGLDEAFDDSYAAESIMKDMIRFVREKEII